MPSDDIVERLREEHYKFHSVPQHNELRIDSRHLPRIAQLLSVSADEIERLRQLLGNSEQLRAERDDARKLYCEVMSNISRQQDCTPQWFAEEMGWDCCKEDSNDR